MKNLLIPFDFSEVSVNALKYALQLTAEEKNVKIHLLHISDSEIKKEEKEKLLKKFEELTLPLTETGNPEISFHIKTGAFIRTLIGFREKQDTDLIVMGTKGAANEQEAGTTNTSEFILAADAPALVIPAGYKSHRPEKIVFALDEEKMHDTSSLMTLLDVSKACNAQVHVLTVNREKESLGHSKADRRNEGALQYYLENFYSHHSFAENEDIIQALDDYIKKHDIDMLAIMPKTHARDMEPSEGRLTRALTLKSEIPVLVLD